MGKKKNRKVGLFEDENQKLLATLQTNFGLIYSLDIIEKLRNQVTPPLGAYPGAPPQPQGPFIPAPPHQAAPQYGVAGGSPYGVAFGGAGGAGGVYPPPYDQLAAQHHQSLPALSQQVPMYSPAAAAAMYAAAASYPGYIGYPVQYYPYYPTMQPSIQPLRPTIMIPNGFEAGARFDGISQPLLPPAPPGVPPTPAQLAAMAGHQVLWR